VFFSSSLVFEAKKKRKRKKRKMKTKKKGRNARVVEFDRVVLNVPGLCIFGD